MRGSPSMRCCSRCISTKGTTSKASSRIASAEASGQSLLEKNSVHSTLPIIRLSGPPSRSGITNSPTAGMKTSMLPATMPGQESGSVTRRKARKGRQPRSAAASSRVGISMRQVGVERQHHEGQIGIDHAEIDRELGVQDVQRVSMTPSQSSKLFSSPLVLRMPIQA